MNLESGKIKNFTDLDAWKEGHSLVLLVYKLTEDLPSGEKYGLVSQMRRSAVSITSNIAEGFGRSSYKEKVQFYYFAQGSASELQNQIMVARDVSFIGIKDSNELLSQSIKVSKILNGLIRKSREFNPDSRFKIRNSRI